MDVADDFPLAVIHAGHVIITDGAGTYKPMPVAAKTAVEGASSYVYTEVDSTGEGYAEKNPKTEGWYTKAGTVYSATNDTEVQNGTTYYVRSGEESEGTTVLVKDENGNQVYVYGSLPAGYAYAGVLYRSVKKSKPLAAIMTNGEVNSEALDIAIDNIKSAFQTACPHIVFIKDETEEEE